MPRNETPLYLYSYQDAEWGGKLDQWWESFIANRDCAREIQSTLLKGTPLPEARFTELLGQWGWKRMEYVMANTVRLMQQNALPVTETDLIWAKDIYIPRTKGTTTASRSTVR